MKKIPENAYKEILRGWKEIEDFLCMGREAIRRAGYPVRYEYTSKRNVFALRQEILDHAVKKKSYRKSCRQLKYAKIR